MLSMETKLYIDGEWTEAGSSLLSPVYNPATGELLTEVVQGGQEQARLAVEAAYRAFPSWSSTAAEVRSVWLRKMYDAIVANADRLGEIMTLEQGKPFEEAKGEVLWGADFLLWYSEEAKRINGEIIPSSRTTQKILVQRQPIGVVAAITPWNFPTSMITRKLAPALAAGCTAVIKPSPDTPLSAIALFEIFDQIGLPKGVVNLVLGDAEAIGREFLDNEKVRKISFTGSTNVGKYLLEQSAKQVKKVSLELGGHAPFIVFEDADLDAAAEGLMYNKFQNGGQTCICANRIFVHASVKDAFVEKFTNLMSELRVGNGMVAGMQMGPLIHAGAVAKVHEHVQDAVDKGATLVYGGSPLTEGEYAKGSYFAPTVLTNVTPEMKIFNEETFGPIAPFIIFENEEEVVQLANSSPYGLASYLYSTNLARTMRVADALEYGMVGVNESSLGYVQAPFGGIKQSGMGREGGQHGVDDFLEYKYINLNF
ncbi:NAD-dependent succinate-semialdehyde dehydrogenase [Paenibacillus alginolyticus]|uniref:NAD-dependent succinate-semialdehyde dehydrogenase n=1 Tax=Paenibacillus alginolyticus TaxID=59839 RepID=A0ABT4G7A2_9BACL|nr:NAD-dependent succinate-semialdehyde dehydrogenase [Paenibacillus alginolyticus]MCY9692035.1 NAD-dependent succinate-semialdehyde dehydrogenase [Paenibacillus alginolyticus]MEC0144225.1 NAD-dependent succinate-semialdehyde dehydrogenase [Paenibacillus alginolyticus]